MSICTAYAIIDFAPLHTAVAATYCTPHTAHCTLHARCSNVPYPPAAPIFIPIHTYRTRPQPACTACLLCNIPAKYHLKKTDCAPSAYPITHPLTHPTVNFLVSSSPRRAIHPHDPRPAIGPRCNHHIDRIVSCGPTWQRTRARYPSPSAAMVGAESLPSHCVWFAVCGRMSAYLPSLPIPYYDTSTIPPILVCLLQQQERAAFRELTR